MDNKPTILIVDDDPKFRKTLSDILRAKGYRAIAAAKGKTALDRVKEEMPAVALIGLKLPDMDGLKVMREIKKRSPDTECIVLTGHASQASVIEAVNLGAYGYMQKPYDMEQLVATIRRAIEKREAEEALRQSEERYRTILDDIEDGYFEVDIAGNFTFFNDSLCRIIGYSRDEMMGMNNRHYMDKENAKKVFQAFSRVYTTGKPTKGFDWEIIEKDGTRRFVEASASPIRGSEGEPIGFRGIVRDITERKRAGEEIRRRSAYLETLQRINATLRSTLPLKQVLEMIVRSTAEALGYLGCFVAMPDARGERLTLGAAWGGRVVDAALKVTRFKLESFSVPVKTQENLIARAFATGKLQISSGEPEGLAAGVEPAIRARMARAIEGIAGARGVVCVPLRVAEKTVGVLLVVSPREQLADEERAMLLGLADQAGLAIENARLYEETQRHLEQVTALQEIDRAISSTLDLSEVLQIILEQLERVIPYHSAAVFFLTDGTARVAAARGFPNLEEVMQVSFPVREDPLAQQLIEERQPLILADAQADERFQARGGTEYVRSWIGVPLIAKGKTLGFLTIDHREPGIYDEESTEMALSFASQGAIAIENAQAYQRLRNQNLQTIAALAAAVEAKDPYTSGHSEKVTQFAIAIAEKMGLSNDEIEDLRVAGLLHDIGKIGIPDSVLNKPARLTPAEFLMIKVHPVIAADIVGRIEALTHLVPIIRHHHERWDGDGYPNGLKGDDIPLLARILAVADGFEAMTAERPYRRARTEEEALAELEKGAGSQWDSQVVEVFVKIYEESAPKH
jgi:PAS domain S-box-containing protein